MKTKYLIIFAILTVFSGFLHAAPPQKIPNAFLGKWASEFKFYSAEGELLSSVLDQETRVRFQKTGMVVKYYSASGYYGTATFYANGQVTSRYRSKFYLEDTGFVDAEYRTSGRWTFNGRNLQWKIRSSAYLPNTDETYYGTFSYKSILIGSQNPVSYVTNTGYFSKSIYQKVKSLRTLKRPLSNVKIFGGHAHIAN